MEALTGFRHILRPDGLSNTLLSQGCVLGAALTMGMVQNVHSKDRGGNEEPLVARVQLTGQPAVVSSLDLFQQWLTQPKLMFPLFWRLEVCYQGVGRVGSTSASLLGLQMAAFPMSPYGVPSVQVSVLISSSEATSHSGSGPTVMISF